MQLFVHAQSPTFKNYTTNDGLPSNEIYKVVEDDDGYLWFATDRGVARYDGYSFEVFTKEDGLGDNVIYWIYKDYKGRLWFAGQNRSISYFENDHFTLHPSSENLKKSAVSKIFSIYVSPNDTVWLGVLGNDAIVKLFPNGEIQPSGEYDNALRTLVVKKMARNEVIFGYLTNHNETDKRAKILIDHDTYSFDTILPKPSLLSHTMSAIANDTTIYTSNVNRIFKINASNPSSYFNKKHTFTVSLFLDYKGSLWAGATNSGVLQFSPENIHMPTHHYLNGYTVTSVTNDREGGYWFTTIEAGVFYCSSFRIKNFSLLHDEDIGRITSITHNDSAIWIASSSGNIHKIITNNNSIAFDKPLWKFEESNSKQVDYYGDVALYADRNQHIWGCFRKLGKVFYFRNDVYHAISSMEYGFIRMIQATDSIYWMSSNLSIVKLKWPDLTLLDTFETQEVSGRINCLELLSKEALCFGSLTGLWILENEKIKRHANHHSLFETRVNDLQKLEDGSLVITSMGNGIIRLAPDGSFFQVTVEDGLPTDLLNCSYTLPGDTITWIGSTYGLTKIVWPTSNNPRPKVTNFNVHNGLKNNDISEIDFFKNQLWIVNGKDVTTIDPYSFHTGKVAPLIHFNGMEVNGIPYKDTIHPALHHNDLIKINFNGISLGSNGNMFYRYRLRGADDQWQLTSSRFVEFKSLPKGAYELEVFAVNSSGTESKNSIHLSFNFLPPFWASWWFRGSIIFILLLVPSIFYALKIRNQRRESNLLAIALESEREALAAHITPHFLFNALNSIQNLIQGKKSKEAQVQLANFALLMRRILQNAKQVKVSLSNELETLQLYLDLEVLRFQETISYDIKTSEGLETDMIFIPPMIIHSFIENSIWHGIGNNQDKFGKVRLSIEIQGDYLLISIIDNGVGREKSQQLQSTQPTTKESTGISYVKRRLDLLNTQFDTFMKFEMLDLTTLENRSAGTEVKIYIPMDFTHQPPTYD